MGRHETIRGPYSPETLAERWGVSSETIRQMTHRGELPSFRVGRSIRIPAQAVEDIECGKSASDGSKAVSSSAGNQMMVGGSDFVLKHSAERKPKQRP
ncbi:excisionase family DNA-binding protein [Paracoccus liaowanqingii]